MLSRWIILVSLISITNLISGISVIKAGETSFDRMLTSGQFRVRHQSLNYTGFRPALKNNNELRMRAGLGVKANDFSQLYLELQATKTLGGLSGYNGTTGTTGLAGSGSGNDDILGVHQAYADITASESLKFKLGRQILNYGDQLLISPLEWQNNGRTFDAAKGTMTHAYGKTEVFYSLIDYGAGQNNTNRKDDDEFYGIYSSLALNKTINEMDLYALRLEKNKNLNHNSSPSPLEDQRAVNTYGLRLKKSMPGFIYRLEMSLQSTTYHNPNQSKVKKTPFQINPEIGYSSNDRLWKIELQYFLASPHFDQLFPLSHEYLGYADLLGRRNVQGYGLRIVNQTTEKLAMQFDAQSFSRKSRKEGAFKIDGITEYQSPSNSLSIGNEFDLTLNYTLAPKNKLIAGFAHFIPGSYLKEIDVTTKRKVNLAYFIYDILF
jgi:hypothetical protein